MDDETSGPEELFASFLGSSISLMTAAAIWHPGQNTKLRLAVEWFQGAVNLPYSYQIRRGRSTHPGPFLKLLPAHDWTDSFDVPLLRTSYSVMDVSMLSILPLMPLIVSVIVGDFDILSIPFIKGLAAFLQRPETTLLIEFMLLARIHS